MPDVRCIDCMSASFNGGDEWARKGQSTCSGHSEALKFDPEARRDCTGFQKAAADVIAKREKWMRDVHAEVGVREAERTRFLLNDECQERGGNATR